ncbi:MAG: DUF4251 domain-containing protein [Rikenellaceae bacterium]|nr:DUF4251 domain-containing protein [Rikenellaceae bacterium]
MKRSVILLIAAIGIFCLPAAAQTEGAAQETRHEQRRREKEEKTRQYCMFMDSLIRTHVYSFRPQSMQMQPAGRNQYINNPAFRMDVRDEYIDVYLPFIGGFLPPYRTTTINYTLPYVPEYRAEQSSDGQEWTITFSSNLFGSDTYHFKLTVTTCTGDAMLEITSSMNNTNTYNGYLSKLY